MMEFLAVTDKVLFFMIMTIALISMSWASIAIVIANLAYYVAAYLILSHPDLEESYFLLIAALDFFWLALFLNFERYNLIKLSFCFLFLIRGMLYMTFILQESDTMFAILEWSYDHYEYLITITNALVLIGLITNDHNRISRRVRPIIDCVYRLLIRYYSALYSSSRFNSRVKKS